MNIQKSIFSKKYIIITTLFLIMIIATCVLFWRNRTDSLISNQVMSCSAYSGTYDSVGPSSVQAMANDYSKAIIIATVEEPKALKASVHVEDPAPFIRVTQVLKGNSEIHQGDLIPICPGMGYIDLQPTKHPTVLVFLEGKDDDVWVPTKGYFGIAPQNKDGSFELTHVRNKPIEVNELEKLIKE